jgi:hypothetical protein
MRFLLATGLVLAIGAGLVVRSVFFNSSLAEPAEASDTPRDAIAPPATAPVELPPPPVSGWVPGGTGTAPPATLADAGASWSTATFPVAQPNPYDVPGDPSQGMVGIAPRTSQASKARAAAAARGHVFTEADLVATRGEPVQ